MTLLGAMAPRLFWAAIAMASFVQAEEKAEAVQWGKDVAAHFFEPTDPSHVHAEAGKINKPTMAIVMTQWCGACNNLRASVNSGTKVKALLDKFLVVYVEDDATKHEWSKSGEDYVPQVHWFSPVGRRLAVYAETEAYKHYFADEDTLEAAMQKALELTASEESHTVNPAHAFDESFSAHFLDNLKPEEMRSKAVEANRPFMVLLTQVWCDACHDLVDSINKGKEVKDLLDAFVVTHAYGDDGLRNWQPEGENYVPQVLFFDADGSLLDVKGPREEYKHFFSSDSDMGSAMAMALDASKTAGEL